jgi:putative DNA primase/helicase
LEVINGTKKKEDKYNEEEIKACYRFLEHLNETEIRIIDPRKIQSPKSIFVHSEIEFINECKRYNGLYNIYVGINERQTNGTTKNDVISIKTLVIDIDAIREKGFEKEPATESELKEAEQVCDNIIEAIKKAKQSIPVKLCSGNGYQLWFAIPEIKIDDYNRQEIEDKSQLFQDLVKNKFDINNAIDKIGDLPRIIKVWGTLNIKSEKGIETSERPFRIAKIIGNSYREENEQLKEQILKLKKDIEIKDYEIETINEIQFDKLPPCINHLLKLYENKDGNYWFRIIQFLASFFMSSGLSEDKTLRIIFDWNKRQPYHEVNEEKEIEITIKRIFKNKIKCPNCKKIKTETGGFPYFGIAELKLCKPDSKCNKCINPIIRYKRSTDDETLIEETTTNVFTDKRELARRFLKIQPLFYDKGKLWWIWIADKFKWEIIDETDVLNAIERSTKANTINSKEKNEIIEALEQEGRKNVPIPIKTTWIQFQDEIIDIANGEKFQANEKYFIVNPIPYKMHNGDYELTPTIDRIFEEWVGKEHVQTLYEIIAYCLYPSYPINRMFFLIGSGMNGKTCFLNLLKKFLGISNVVSTELDILLNSRFEITKLHKKLICIMGETNFNEISHTSILKKLTGGDLIGFEYKNKNPFDDYNYAKIIIATNNLPTTTDKTVGFYRRMTIIDFPNQFSEEKDILLDIPEEEYESLALKCTGILHNLIKIRKFTNEGSVEDRMKKYEDKSNPILKFIKENTEENFNEFITSKDFTQKLNDWCRTHRFRTFDERTIGKTLKEMGYEKGRKHFDWAFDGKGGQIYVYFGLKWKN